MIDRDTGTKFYLHIRNEKVLLLLLFLMGVMFLSGLIFPIGCEIELRLCGADVACRKNRFCGSDWLTYSLLDIVLGVYVLLIGLPGYGFAILWNRKSRLRSPNILCYIFPFLFGILYSTICIISIDYVLDPIFTWLDAKGVWAFLVMLIYGSSIGFISGIFMYKALGKWQILLR